MTELCDIAFKYGTDKCPQIKHHFTEFYHELFGSRRNSIYKVVEIGIGRLAPSLRVGASLFMWQEYFPNALVIGADIDKDLLFRDKRIRTLRCDQTKAGDLEALVKISEKGHEIDLFIDDGLHTPESQIFTCLTVMPLLGEHAIYMIEDVGHREIVEQLSQYRYKILKLNRRKFNDDCMVMVRHK